MDGRVCPSLTLFKLYSWPLRIFRGGKRGSWSDQLRALGCTHRLSPDTCCAPYGPAEGAVQVFLPQDVTSSSLMCAKWMEGAKRFTAPPAAGSESVGESSIRHKTANDLNHHKVNIKGHKTYVIQMNTSGLLSTASQLWASFCTTGGYEAVWW